MTARQGLRLVLVGLGTSVVPLDTAVNIAFPEISRNFDLSVEMIQWVVICYVLTYSSLMLAFGRVGDVWSHGRVFRVGLLWSGVAYFLCAAAPNYGLLLVCRFLQGIGASLIVSCAPALVTGLFPEERRGRAVALFTLMYAIGSAAGPLLGGALVQLWGWPAVFWFRAPLALVALLFAEDRPALSRSAPREPVDIAGAVLLALAISTLLLTLNRLQHLREQAFFGILLLGIAGSILIGFVYWENRIAEPIVNLGLFRIRGFAGLNIASVLVYLTSFSVLLLGPYYLVRFAGLSVAMAGGVLGASFVGSLLASPLAGRIIERVPAGRLAAVGAWLCAGGLILIARWQPGGEPGAAQETAAILGTLVLQGFGVGLFQVSYMDIVMRTLPRRQRGVAGSIAMLSRSVGVVTGATLLTLVFHTIEAMHLSSGAEPTASFLSGFRATFWAAGIVAGLAGLLVLFATRRGR
jgi:EmrB/QacA subfamily drug resistance transporter